MASPGPSNLSAQQNLEAARSAMQKNIKKISQRGDGFDSLVNKSNNLAVSAQQYRGVATEKRREMWRRRKTLSFCLIGGIGVIVAIVLFILVIIKKI
jgi:flagellar biosynthesis/type III secretory pathway M-ring protein FliF/YscJ